MYFDGNYNSHCNTAKRFDPDCILSSEFANKVELVQSALYEFLFPYVQDNESCVKEIYNYNYW